MHLIIDTHGASIEREDFRFKITNGQQERMIAPGRITSINLIKGATISSAAILLAAEYEIPVIIFNRTGKPAARMWSSYAANHATIRRNQVKFAEHPQCIQWLHETYRLKTAGQCQNLERWADRRPRSRDMVGRSVSEIQAKTDETIASTDLKDARQRIMNLDAQTSRLYWDALSDALQQDMPFEKRSRQPAEDPFNASVNYLYGMLYAVVEGAVIGAGLDPQLGFLHSDDFVEPTFVFDCIEPFRPWTDGLLLHLILEKKLTSECFEAADGGVWVSRAGKKILIPAFYAMMKESTLFNQRRIKREDQIRHFCTQTAQQLKDFTPG